jgi:RND family efflux transporter MFP subunit
MSDAETKKTRAAGRLGWLRDFLLRRGLPLLLVVLAIGAVVVLQKFLPPRSRESEAGGTEPEEVAIRVIQPRTVLHTIELDGRAEPNEIVIVSAQVPGEILHYGAPRDGNSVSGAATVKEGDFVREGQPLMRIDPNDYIAQREQAQAKLAYDRAELQRLERLAKQGLAGQSELDAARRALRSSKAAYRLAVENVRRTVIRAKATGTLDKLMVEVGEYVGRGTPVAKIVDTREMKISVNVPEKYTHYLRENGREHTIVRSSAGPLNVKGRITYKSVLADPATLTTPIEIKVPNRDRFHSGQSVIVRLVLRELTDQIMVPLDAVVHLEDGYAVYVSEDGRAKRVRMEVDLELLQGKQVRVLAHEESGEGLEHGDRLIVRGQRYVAPGEPIRETHVNGRRVWPTTGPAATAPAGEDEE